MEAQFETAMENMYPSALTTASGVRRDAMRFDDDRVIPAYWLPCPGLFLPPHTLASPQASVCRD